MKMLPSSNCGRRAGYFRATDECGGYFRRGRNVSYPIYAKWADAYKKRDRRWNELSVHRLWRRNQARSRPRL